jgi:hypothetical protein
MVLDNKRKFSYFFRIAEMNVHLGFLYFVHGLIYILRHIDLCCLIYA